jgi:hypothetical protein
MKYKWSLRRFWWSWLKQDYKKLFYKVLYGWNMSGFGGTMIPTTGKGKYVSVYRKGDIIQIKHESGYDDLQFDEIRIIPYQPNHGVMVERWKDCKMYNRHHLDIKQLNKSIIYASNIEALASKKKKNEN